MSIIPCLSWVPVMLEQICGLFVQNTTTNTFEVEVDLPYERIVDETTNTVEEVDLPYEIIADILSRLPAKTVILCTDKCKPLLDLVRTPSFIDLHLARSRATTQLITFYYQPLRGEHHNPCDGNNCTEVVDVCFTSQKKSDNYVIRSSPIDVCANHCVVNKKCLPILYGSCNGLLLFISSFCESLLSIWNPVTGERNTVVSPLRGSGRVRGFFFHPKAEDYKVIFLSLAPRFRTIGVNCVEYHIYGCKTKTVESIQRYSHAPTSDRNPVLLNGVLHWTVCDVFHKRVQGAYPSCSNSILLFDIYTEKFSSMSHPGGQCSEEGRHRRMQLMENEGHLYFCNPSSSHDIVIWRLEDYKNEGWVQIHVIQEPNKVLFGNPPFGRTLIPVDIHNGEIIIHDDGRGIFLYNMSFCSFRKFENEFTGLNLLVYPFYHIDSLVSLKKSIKEV